MSDVPSDATKYAQRPTVTTGLPGGIPYIIGNEAAERFSFYGMKAILTIFMVDYLQWMGGTPGGGGMSDAEATEHYHTFTAAAYFFPILGALLSDVFLGKYRTILFLSIVYCLGHAALAMMGAPPLSAGYWLFVGLLLISVGSGGIKPCVSAHVGDQFGKSNAHLLTKVYQWFYFSINFGAFISTLLTPWLLEHYGPHWAFGVPGVLMALATFLFWLGRNKFVHIPAGGTKFLKETFSWTGVSAILKLMIIFCFVAVFWALFDQTGSSWVLQAKSLDRTWMGVTWLESQIQAVNPILILTLIPLFQFFFYPAIDQVFPLTPIRRISLGLFVMTGGFAIVAWLQQQIDAGLQPSIAWQFLAYAVLTASEVMVSITCLEFAYTQAPKTMKSVVMAVFLLSVSLGNIFTAVVNNVIQTPSVISIAEQVDVETITGVRDADSMRQANAQWPIGDEWNAKWASPSLAPQSDEAVAALRLAGHDGETDTGDDVWLLFGSDAELAAIRTQSRGVLETAADRIEAAFFKQAGEGQGESRSALLPDEDAGGRLIEGLQDAFGNPIEYRLVSRDRYQLISQGGDESDETRWDETLTGAVDRAAEPSDDEQTEPTFNWLEQRRIEMVGGDDPEAIAKIRQEILSSRGGGSETNFKRQYAVGGRVLLEGDDYFWFWTTCIFVTAVLFVPVGYLYREKTYIQDEDEAQQDAEAAAEESMGH